LDDRVDGNTEEQQMHKTTYKKERKTKQKQQGSKENTEMRRGERESLPSSLAKPHKAVGRAPLRRRP
jgi:hypothetical protein